MGYVDVLIPGVLLIHAIRRWLAGRRWSRPATCRAEDFPPEFTPQSVRLPTARWLVELPPPEIATHFRVHPEQAQDLLGESYDKRYTPSTFFQEHEGGYRVGWVQVHAGLECIRRFSNLADAATDYLLFSLGKGRWDEPQPPG